MVKLLPLGFSHFEAIVYSFWVYASNVEHGVIALRVDQFPHARIELEVCLFHQRRLHFKVNYDEFFRHDVPISAPE